MTQMKLIVDDILKKYYEEDHAFIKSEKKHLLNISTNATKDETLNFWLKLQGNNKKEESYWESKQEIEYFVDQNFEGFPGVNEIKRDFNPNMNKSELNQTLWTFFDTYGRKDGTKKQYAKLLKFNFIKFKNDDLDIIYSNIKDQFNKHLKGLFK